MTVSEKPESQEARLARIESVQARTVANLETVSSDLGRLASAVDTLRDSLANTGKTQWNVLGTWVGVLMAIGAAVIAPQMADIRQLHSKSVVQDRAIQSNAVMLGRLEERLAGRIERGEIGRANRGTN
jgi:LPXTG-motif cell wall-anchored protein